MKKCDFFDDSESQSGFPEVFLKGGSDVGSGEFQLAAAGCGDGGIRKESRLYRSRHVVK